MTAAHRLPPYAPERHGRFITRSAVKRQLEDYRRLPVSARRDIPGMEPPRADIILAGAMIVAGIMGRFGFERVQVSRYGLSYGLLAERAAAFV